MRGLPGEWLVQSAVGCTSEDPRQLRRADPTARPRARGVRPPRRPARPGLARAIGHGAGGPGELGDGDAIGVRSRTMILIHLDRIEHTYSISKSASSSPARGLALKEGEVVGRNWSRAVRILTIMYLAWQEAFDRRGYLPSFCELTEQTEHTVVRAAVLALNRQRRLSGPSLKYVAMCPMQS
jgi:hypothetical protein